VPVIGAGVAVLGCRAAELGHRDHDDVGHAIAEVARERRKARAELAQDVLELVVLVGVMVPSVEIHESDLDADVGLDQTRQLHEPRAELALIDRAVRRGVGLLADRFNPAHGVEHGGALALHPRIGRSGVEPLEDRRAVGAHLELRQVVNGDRAAVAAQRLRQRRADGDAAQRGGVGRRAGQRAIQPAVRDPRPVGSGFH
jgi:hypothetical protein